MKKEKIRKSRTAIKVLAIIILVVVILFGSFLIYANDYYKADENALKVLSNQNVEEFDDYIFIRSENSDTAFIFYPGAKVQYEAYLPMLEQISISCGVNVILTKMPFNMAIFDSNRADEFVGKLQGVTRYYVGGHSMGGAMASDYASKNADKIDGLILFGAYIYGDYPPKNTLTIYGSLNEKVEEKLFYTENVVKIEGGNHANFGNYGNQKGDKESLITREEQQEIAVNAIKEFLN